MTALTLEELAPTLKAGQRVRVTFEGVVKKTDPNTDYPAALRDANGKYDWLPAHGLAEVLHDPIKVGDRVRSVPKGPFGVVRHTIEDRAWVEWANGNHTCSHLCNLERIP